MAKKATRRRGQIVATSLAQKFRPRPAPRSAAHPRGKAIGLLPMRPPFYTPAELQQYEYMDAISAEPGGTMTDEYRQERRAWRATTRRAAKRYGAKRAKSRPRLVKHTKAGGRIKVRAYTRRRPGGRS